MIVVVDDYEDSAKVLARLLKQVGYETVVKTCGPDLLDYLQTNPLPTLVILDLMMPGMDGFQCLKEIRAKPEWKDMAVVMYSADFSYDRMKESLRLGAQEYVVKGAVLWDNFVRTVNKYAKSDWKPPAA
jgi:CheY-like chemotaxis protein